MNKQIDWNHVAVATPVLVRDSPDDEWVICHFASYEDGKVHTWVQGLTSFSVEGVSYKTDICKEVKLYKKEG